MKVQTADTELMDVRFVSGEAYEVAVRGHRVMIDQPRTPAAVTVRRPRLSCS